MNILAIDASTKSTGIALFSDKKLEAYECFTASSTDLTKRIYKITNLIKDFLSSHSVDIIILEEVLPEKNDNDNTHKNLKTYKALMYLQANLVFMVHDNFPNIEIKFVYPSSWRSKNGISTGRGIKRESLKAKDISLVYNIYNINVNDDIADAILIGRAETIEEKKDFNWGE